MATTGFDTLDTTALASQVLTAARALAEPSLRAAVDGMPASMRRVAGYHLGWWDADGVAAHGNGGKAIRPALALSCARAVGGDPVPAVPAAVAVELVHNFSLLHDDVIDGDRTRRHRPTAWAVFGTADAIVAADAMLALAIGMLADPPLAAGRLAAAVIELCDGQMADVAFERRGDVDLDEVMRMAAGKTGALLGCACALGAYFGGAGQTRVEIMARFGRQLGLLFQLVDDMLGIWGDPAATGKPAGADLASRKKSLPVVAALCSGTDAGRELAELYRDRSSSPARLAALVETAGGRDWARRRSADVLADAVGTLREADCEPAAARDLLAIAQLISSRDR